MTDDTRTPKQKLQDEATALGIDVTDAMTVADLETAIAAHGAANTSPATTTAPGGPTVSDPDDPDNGRPPLGQTAEDRAANAYVREISSREED